MTSGLTNVQEKSDLIKLAKALALKSAQVIIQARDGNKMQTKCNPSVSGHLTFNLALHEHADIDKEARRTMSMTLSEKWSFCIEIYLKTVDGDMMVLETWNISLMPDAFEYKQTYALYSRMELLLKSLLAITRVVPAYRYSRRQSSDSYLIGHRMYSGEPEFSCLGDKYKYLKVGCISTPIGRLMLSVYYRTIMTISPQPSGIDTSIIVKSDHFRPDFSPKFNRNQRSDDSMCDEVSYRVGAFVESRRESLNPIDSDQLIPNVPFGSLLARAQQSPPSNNVASQAAAFLTQLDSVREDAQIVEERPSPTKSINDGFIVIEKPLPFAEVSKSVELSQFYFEWKAAPILHARSDPKVADQIGDLSKQLAGYESRLKEFDSVITSLCENSESNEDITTPFVM